MRPDARKEAACALGARVLGAPPPRRSPVKDERRPSVAVGAEDARGASMLRAVVPLLFAPLTGASSTAQVFNFVAQRLLRAWRPREFDQACVEMRLTPQSLLDLVLSIASIVFLSYAAYQGPSRRFDLLLCICCLFAPTELRQVKSFLNKSYQALKQL